MDKDSEISKFMRDLNALKYKYNIEKVVGIFGNEEDGLMISHLSASAIDRENDTLYLNFSEEGCPCCNKEGETND